MTEEYILDAPEEDNIILYWFESGLDAAYDDLDVDDELLYL